MVCDIIEYFYLTRLSWNKYSLMVFDIKKPQMYIYIYIYGWWVLISIIIIASNDIMKILRQLGQQQQQQQQQVKSVEKCIKTTDTTCFGNTWGYFHDCETCAAFYQCVWGKPYRHPCPQGLVFDTSISVCTWESTTCENGIYDKHARYLLEWFQELCARSMVVSRLGRLPIYGDPHLWVFCIDALHDKHKSTL